MAHRSSNIERNLWTVDMLDLSGDEKVLEIGCGPGVGLKAVCKKLNYGTVTGIDHSTTMLEQAGGRLEAELSSGSCCLQLGGLELLPDHSTAFDRIYSANVVQFLADKDEAFAQIYDALEAKGLCATTYQPRHKNPIREDALDMATQIKTAMIRAGFCNIGIHELALKPVPAICVTGRRN